MNNKYLNIINIFLIVALVIVGTMIIYDIFIKNTSKIDVLYDRNSNVDIKDENSLSISDTDTLPEEFSNNLRSGDQYMSIRRWNEAILEYQKVLERNKENVYSMYQLSKIYLILNNIPKAEEYIKNIETITGETTQLIILKSKIFFKKMDYTSAKNMLIEKVKVYNNDDSLLYQLGLAYIGTSEYKNAELTFKKINTDNTVIDKTKNVSNAFKDLNTYKDYTDMTADVFISKSLILNYDIDVARYILKRAITKVRDYKDAWIYLSVTYILDKNYEEALSSLKTTLAISPTDHTALFYLAEVFFATGRYNDAIGAYNKSLEYGYPNKNIINDKLARSYILTGQYDLARMIYTKYLITPENAKNISSDMYSKPIWLMLYKIKDTELALQFAYLALNSLDNAITNNNVGWVLIEKGELEEAENYLKKALSIDDKYAAVYLNLGDLNIKKNNKDKAKQYYKACFDLDKSEEIGDVCSSRLNSLK